MKPHRATVFGSLITLLAACSFMPSTQAPSLGSQPRVPIHLASDTPTPAPGQSVKRETFPSRVTTTPLKQADPDAVAAVEEAVKEVAQSTGGQPGSSSGSSGVGSWGSSSTSTENPPGFHILSFQVSAGPQQIQIPATGSFRLEVQVGEKFAILDGDARDGLAQLQLPAGQLDTLLKLETTGQARLKLEDRLYAVSDEVQTSEWQHVGLRPLPVPANWYEPEGKLVLYFTTQQVEAFQISWVSKTAQAALPPGIKEIGSEGGVVELPGVASLNIPAGALSQPTVIRMRQQMEAASHQLYCPNPYIPDECFDGWVFASPIVRIDPLELELHHPVQLDLPIYEFFERYAPIGIESRAIGNPFRPPVWGGMEYLTINPDIKKLSDKNRHNIPIWIKRFGYIVRQKNYTPSVEKFLTPFQIQQSQLGPCQQGESYQDKITEHFYILDDVC